MPNPGSSQEEPMPRKPCSVVARSPDRATASDRRSPPGDGNYPGRSSVRPGCGPQAVATRTTTRNGSARHSKPAPQQDRATTGETAPQQGPVPARRLCQAEPCRIGTVTLVDPGWPGLYTISDMVARWHGGTV